MMVGYFESSEGSKSMMRLLAFWGFILGGVIALSGVVGMFMGIAASGTAMLTGGGLAGGGEALKAFQKKHETK